MELSENKYYTFTYSLMCLTGQWPYQNPMKKKVARIITFFVIVFIFIAHSGKLISKDLSTDVITDVISYIVLSIEGFMCMTIIYSNDNKIELLLNRIQIDWIIQKTETEKQILQDCAVKSKKFAEVYGLYAIVTTALLIPVSMMPQILDVVWPLNQSRPHSNIHNIELFLDEDKYYYIIILQISILLLWSCVLFVCNFCMFIVFMYHLYGKIRTVGFHLEFIFDNMNHIHEISFNSKNDISYRKLCLGIEQHKSTMEFSAICKSCYGRLFSILLIGSVIQTTFTLSQMHDLRSINYKPLCYAMGQLICFGFAAHIGQNLLDVSDNLSKQLYNSSWYNCPPKTQKLLLSMMQYCQIPNSLTACSIYVLSLETFQAFMQTYISYCMVINKVR